MGNHHYVVAPQALRFATLESVKSALSIKQALRESPLHDLSISEVDLSVTFFCVLSEISCI